MNIELLKLIREEFRKHPVTVGESVPDEEIRTLEEALEFNLPSDYKDFVREFGGGIVGPFSIYGLRAADAMSEDESSALDVTLRFRQDGWIGTDKWLVISSDHAGNPIGLDATGSIWISDHDAGTIEKVADSFENYLKNKCLNQ